MTYKPTCTDPVSCTEFSGGICHNTENCRHAAPEQDGTIKQLRTENAMLERENAILRQDLETSDAANTALHNAFMAIAEELERYKADENKNYNEI